MTETDALMTYRAAAYECWKASSFVDEMDAEQRRNFEETCDQLMSVDDGSVQVMVMKALFLAHAFARQPEIVISLLNSNEIGQLYFFHSSSHFDIVGRGEVAQEARNHLLHSLDAGSANLLETLEEKCRHWTGVMDPEAQTIEDYRTKSVFECGEGEEPGEAQRTDEEAAEAMRSAMADVWAMACEDLSSYAEEYASGVCAEHAREVRDWLKRIIRITLFGNQHIENIVKCWEYLATFAGYGHYPARWLCEISGELLRGAKEQDFAPALRKLLIGTQR